MPKVADFVAVLKSILSSDGNRYRQAEEVITQRSSFNRRLRGKTNSPATSAKISPLLIFKRLITFQSIDFVVNTPENRPIESFPLNDASNSEGLPNFAEDDALAIMQNRTNEAKMKRMKQCRSSPSSLFYA